MSTEKEKQIVVSDLFKETYLNFNVSSQIENMKNLDKRELYLFLTYALDKHSDEDPVVLHNFQPFKDEVMEIYDIQDDKETTNEILLVLIEETGDKYIETDNVLDSEGNKLREPYTKQEVREAKIDILNDEK
jgi:Fe-S-cluster formation regulator IscX/YfhJ